LLDANIAGGVLKNCAPSESLRTVQEMLERSTYFSARIKTLLEQSFVFPMRYSSADVIERFTKQGAKVLEWVAKRSSNKYIGRGVSA
jgi:DNA-binding NarL/FixJ family response regulator